jgi:hypothetical protein
LNHFERNTSAKVFGERALDRWFESQAGQDERRNIARVFVAIDDLGIAGFYSLSMCTLSLDDLPSSLSRKLPNYSAIPAALIGSLYNFPIYTVHPWASNGS